MKVIISSFESEFRRYYELGLGVLQQLNGEEFSWRAKDTQNSIATIVWHISGNLKSRFTDFLISDGEKSWRDREGEFEFRKAGKSELLDKWEDGWSTLFDCLSSVVDANLQDGIKIRGQELSVHHALCRSLAHTSYHVGQMVQIGREIRGSDWNFLSIPPGGTKAYNQNPTREHGPESDLK